MSILAIIAIIVAFCVGFWVCRTQVKPPWQTLAYCVWAAFLILFCLWIAGVFPSDVLSTRIGRR